MSDPNGGWGEAELLPAPWVPPDTLVLHAAREKSREQGKATRRIVVNHPLSGECRWLGRMNIT